MSYTMSVTYAGDYVEVHSTGDKNLQTAAMLWQKITRICAEHNCYRVLGISRSDRPMPIMDSVKHQELFKDFKVTYRYKVAWVELNPAALGNVKFLEMFVQNRCLVNGRLFHDVGSAKQWLLSDQPVVPEPARPAG
jgi:hypothetical protein